MPTSDKDIENLQERVAEARQQLVDVKAARETAEREMANDVTKANLERELATLQTEISKEKSRSDVAAGITVITDNAKEVMKQALEQQEAQKELDEAKQSSSSNGNGNGNGSGTAPTPVPATPANGNGKPAATTGEGA